MADRGLDTYRAKRDPARTPEPFGAGHAGDGRRFVVHKHAARRLHYDLRLEIDGVLKSWAVPKGPSVRPHEKRLAVHVEDHPVEYAAFEGVIPEGSYGAGPSIVWDAGWYRLTTPEPAAAQLARGRLEFELFGFKLGGRWTLARMSGKEREWLLLKKADAFASDREPTERQPESALSGLTVEELRTGTTKLAALRARLDALGAPARAVTPRPRAPMLATLVGRPFSDPAWLFEIKYDGVRVLAERAGGRVELRSRSGQDVTVRYPEIARALRALPLDRFLLDGEIVALDDAGRSSFQRLQARMGLARPDDVARAEATAPVNAVVFDALALDGRDLRGLPLEARKECLRLVLPARGVVAWSDHVVEHGEAFFAAASERGLEGIVAKRRASRYAPGRSRDWLKVKCQRRQEFVVGGWTAPRGSRAGFGALHLGLFEAGRLVYVSKVGTGFDDATLAALHARLVRLERPTTPFAVGSPAGRGHHWVEPRLVCEARFAEWTKDGGLRHPTFVGLRDDKRPEDCVRERPAAMAAARGAAPAERPAAPDDGERRVTITNPTKVFWPEEGLTKADLVAYYDRVAPWLLPYLADRPLVLTRYPDGIGGKSFYQKDAPEWTPTWVRRQRIPSGDAGRDIEYLVVDDRESLRWVVNLGTIPLHLWASRVGGLDHPDWLILDLDPKGAPFGDVVKVAQALRRLLETLELPSCVKTSGATGLHVLLPLGGRYRYEEARGFAHLLAMLGVEAEPGIATVARPIRARGGKVYIDYGQNARSQTIVAPLAVRPLPGAPVSCPLRWQEVTARLDPRRFTIRTLPARLDTLGDPLAPVLGPGIDVVAALGRLERLAGRPG